MAGAGFGSIDVVAREATLFAAIWFLVGGIDDLLVDLVYLFQRARGWLRGERRAELPEVVRGGRMAVFVAAWHEANVIGPMLRTALERFDYPDYCIYVGTYSNDPATIEAVAEVAASDPRIRLVIGPKKGPTTKADCLNTIWRALLRDEASGEAPASAVVLHDAEDVVHAQELRIFAWELQQFHAVQLPVLPLCRPGSPIVSGHYCDEFAEAHAKQMPVRQMLGAAIPFAGVGCAVRRDMIDRIATARSGEPFDSESLTEDYEMGLTIATMGGRTLFARVREAPGGPLVAVRAYFPDAVRGAVFQKARWMAGIALAGWDRIGWSGTGKLSDYWMRMRDRRAILEIPVLASAYCALVTSILSMAGHLVTGTGAPPLSPMMRLAVSGTFIILAWRLAVRIVFVARAYGWRAALWVPARAIAGNIIALMAAWRAAFLYAQTLAGAVPHWDKTEHHFPDDPERATA